ncbi:hypothetical protein Plhal304r1_c009g0036161 [Plasmopara halstedii]
MEDKTANLELNDNETIARVQGTEEENDDQEMKCGKEIVMNLEKLKSLRVTASPLVVTNLTDRAVLRRIRELQKSPATVQTTINSWLVSN